MNYNTSLLAKQMTALIQQPVNNLIRKANPSDANVRL